MKNGILFFAIVLTLTNCCNNIHRIISFKDPSFEKYYSRHIENGVSKETHEIYGLVLYNSVVSSVSDNYKARIVSFSIEQDSLLVYFDNQKIKSLNDVNSLFQMTCHDGHTRKGFSSKYYKTKSNKVIIIAEYGKLKLNESKTQIYDLDKKSKEGKYFEFDSGANLVTKGFYQLLDSARVDTIHTYDYNTYEESFTLKKQDQTWYKSGIWKYFDKQGKLLKNVSFMDNLVKMSNDYRLRD